MEHLQVIYKVERTPKGLKKTEVAKPLAIVHPNEITKQGIKLQVYENYLNQMIQTIMQGRSKISNSNPFYMSFEIKDTGEHLEIRNTIHKKKPDRLFYKTEEWYKVKVEKTKIIFTLNYLQPH